MSGNFIDSLISAFPDVPFQKLLGIQIVSVTRDKAVVRLPFRAELAGGGNALHGGTISSLLDLTGALAAWLTTTRVLPFSISANSSSPSAMP